MPASPPEQSATIDSAPWSEQPFLQGAGPVTDCRNDPDAYVVQVQEPLKGAEVHRLFRGTTAGAIRVRAMITRPYCQTSLQPRRETSAQRGKHAFICPSRKRLPTIDEAAFQKAAQKRITIDTLPDQPCPLQGKIRVAWRTAQASVRPLLLQHQQDDHRRKAPTALPFGNQKTA